MQGRARSDAPLQRHNRGRDGARCWQAAISSCRGEAVHTHHTEHACMSQMHRHVCRGRERERGREGERERGREERDLELDCATEDLLCVLCVGCVRIERSRSEKGLSSLVPTSEEGSFSLSLSCWIASSQCLLPLPATLSLHLLPTCLISAANCLSAKVRLKTAAASLPAPLGLRVEG